MTTQSAFTEEEWAALSAAPGLVAVAIAKSGDSGFFGGLKELRAIVKLLKNAEDTYAEVELISTLLDGLGSDDAEERIDTDDVGKLSDEAVGTCASANAALAKATNAEAQEYRRWILDIATQVAEAAKEDGVLVSASEVALIERIQAALGGLA